MKKTTLIVSSLILTGSMLSSSVLCFADEEKSPENAIIEGGTLCSDAVSISRTITLDYPSNQIQTEYHVTNTSSSDEVCSLYFPVISSLESSHSDMYSFSSDDVQLTESFFFSPLFSTEKINQDDITVEQLASYETEEIHFDDVNGTLFSFSGSSLEEAQSVLEFQVLSSESCKLFPLNCTYSLTDESSSLYQVSIPADTDTAYLFLTGEEDSSFKASAIESSFEVQTDAYSLSEFAKLTCDTFINKNTLDSAITSSVLQEVLSHYLQNCSSLMSLDFYNTLQWLLRQQLFDVYSCQFTLPANADASITILREEELPVKRLTFNPILLATMQPLTANTFQFVFPETYTTASARKASASYKKDTQTLTMKNTPKGSYEISISKTPIWVKTYKYIGPMSVVMILFLVLCIIPYSIQKKKQK